MFFLLAVDSIAVDELRVYWTSQDNLSVYYVLRDDPSSLMTLTSTSLGYDLLGLSPGQQPWSAVGKMALAFLSNCTEYLDLSSCRGVLPWVSMRGSVRCMFDSGPWFYYQRP